MSRAFLKNSSSLRLGRDSIAASPQLQRCFSINTTASTKPAVDLSKHADDSGSVGRDQSSNLTNGKDLSTKNKKTIAELDEEMRQRMSDKAGDGGEAGVEYEDGKPVAMKRSVKNNMFRYI
ncbi:hypothetical protein BX600DRAFT_492062 [Xylariales sp. PMI_506]|nr:hypothetical protein BX600DRAFT_492062 [Xylariales sp. PMI_506]